MFTDMHCGAAKPLNKTLCVKSLTLIGALYSCMLYKEQPTV